MDLMADLLTVSEAARAACVSSQWIRMLGIRGELPYVATPHGKLYPRQAVEQITRKRPTRRGTIPGNMAQNSDAHGTAYTA